MKPGKPLLLSPRFLDQLRERIRYLHYSLNTEKVYVYWVRFFIRWCADQGGHGHSYRARAFGAFRCVYDNDLYPCAESGSGRSG